MGKLRNFKSFVFAAGLSCSAVVAIALEGTGRLIGQTTLGKLDLGAMVQHRRPNHNWTSRETQAAQIAWRYIENNLQPETGWVNSVDGFPSSTLWDQGSYLFALISAQRLGIVSQDKLDRNLGAFLHSLAQIELLPNGLPNKVYNTRSLVMTDYADTHTPDGIGWSALDIARLLMALRVVERHNPQYGPEIRAIISQWGLDQMGQMGELIGGAVTDDGSFDPVQEGRIGYEQYGARASALWGLDVTRAMSADRIVDFKTVSQTEVPIDLRNPRTFEAINPTLSEPYVLMALEMGLDSESHALAKAVYEAQENRWVQDEIVTVVSEDHLDQAPHFVYAAVHSNNRPWAVVDADGARFDHLRTQSTKMSFGWDAIYNTDYTDMTVDRVYSMHDPARGWQAGIYEATGERNAALALNTNAVILEALHYMKFGPLWSVVE